MGDSTQHLATHCFALLFRGQLGWTSLRTHASFKLLGGTCVLPIAHKQSFMVFVCAMHPSDLCNHHLLHRHQRELRRQFHELILIHYCSTPRKQVWQWVTGASDDRRLAHRQPEFFSDCPPHSLLARLEKLAVGREREGELTQGEALNSVRAALLPTSELDALHRRLHYASSNSRVAVDLKAGVPAAFSELVESHMQWARKVSRKLAGWFDIDREDGQQMAILALLEGVQRFDPSQDNELSAYLSLRLGIKCRRLGLKSGLVIHVPYAT